jgi:hypothetical protein
MGFESEDAVRRGPADGGDVEQGARRRPVPAAAARVQALLVVGRSDDPLEHEADRVAAEVLASLTKRAAASRESPPSRIRRATYSGSVIGAEGGTVDGELTSRIRRAGGVGVGLDESTRSTMEGAFGVDLGRVRVHASAESAELNRALGARAFTHGTDIHLGADAHSLGSVDGTRLLAHELVHVVQQGGAGVERSAIDAGPVTRSTEDVSLTPRRSAANKTVVGRKVIPRAVTGLKTDLDPSSPKEFAQAIDAVYNEDVLQEMKRLIEADQASPGLPPEVVTSNQAALDCVGDRLKSLGVSRLVWQKQSEPGRVKLGDKAYDKYGVKDSFDLAEKLIDGAVAKLGSISVSTPTSNPVMRTFRSFFTTATPGGILGRLRFVKAQIAHYRPQCPPGTEAGGGGHACFDDSEEAYKKYQYFNDGLGADARLIIGPKAVLMTPGARAYNIIHEATHGTRGLSTIDHAYRWQRIFSILTPEQQVANADSYGMLVGVLGGLTEAAAGMTDTEQLAYDLSGPAKDVETSGLPVDVTSALNTSWAWLEDYATKMFLNSRDLLNGVSTPEPFAAGSYQKRFYDVIASVFKLGDKGDKGVRDIVDQMQAHMDALAGYVAYAKPVFCATASKTPPGGGRFELVVPPSLGTNLKSMTLWHIRRWCGVEGISADLAQKYEQAFEKVVQMSKWPGPLSA